MCNDPVATMVVSENGELAFQEYFVKYQWQPRVKEFRFEGAESASLTDEVRRALEKADVVIIAPSNPWVSIAPIVALPGMWDLLQQNKVVAVSPIIGGQAVKGPAAKMFSEMGIQPSALAVAQKYQGLIDAFVMDVNDAHEAPAVKALGIKAFSTDIMMKNEADRRRLAGEVLQISKTMTVH
jgi:LPPG:FO 2-phospho-L-lactate transferase